MSKMLITLPAAAAVSPALLFPTNLNQAFENARALEGTTNRRELSWVGLYCGPQDDDFLEQHRYELPKPQNAADYCCYQHDMRKDYSKGVLPTLSCHADLELGACLQDVIERYESGNTADIAITKDSLSCKGTSGLPNNDCDETWANTPRAADFTSGATAPVNYQAYKVAAFASLLYGSWQCTPNGNVEDWVCDWMTWFGCFPGYWSNLGIEEMPGKGHFRYDTNHDKDTQELHVSNTIVHLKKTSTADRLAFGTVEEVRYWADGAIIIANHWSTYF